MRDLISVIVPVYNRDKYLRETLDSVLNQSYKNLEIILIDDGSSDYALNILKEYERRDKRVKTLTQNNAGICIAIRRALMMCNGEYVCRCDSDDINDFYRYEKQLEYLKQGGYDLVGCYINAFGLGGGNQRKYIENCVNKPMRSEKEVKERFLLGQPITGSTMFARKDALLEVMPFHKDYSKIEDYYLTIMMYKAGKKISIVEEKLLNYRIHDNNLSLSGDDEILRKHTEISFRYMFYDKICESEMVTIFRMKKDSYYLNEIIYKHFSKIMHKFFIVNEDEVDEFLKNNIKKLETTEKNIIFYGVNFSELSKILIKNLGYQAYSNIFMSGY